MDGIWWTKVTNATLFIDAIVNNIQQGNSVIVQLTDNIPWYMTMKNIIETELVKQNSTRAYKYIIDGGIDPGEYLFNEFCKKEKRAHYRPGIGYADFLANSDDIVLNECILWISDINKTQMKKWYSFVERYKKILGKKVGCVFLLEVKEDNNLQEKRGIKKIVYENEIEQYDNYLFNMLVASRLKESSLFKQYIVEAVSIMLPDDIELSAQCISYEREFLEDPFRVIQNIIETESRSDGRAFSVLTKKEEMQVRLWEVQIKVIFPLLEKCRNEIVEKYKNQIEILLPITAAYGEVFKEASDVELGTISYLLSSGKIQMEHEDACKVRKLKDARNTLAHVRVLSQKDVDEILLA